MTAFLRLIEDNIKKWFEYFPIDMGLKFEQGSLSLVSFSSKKCSSNMPNGLMCFITKGKLILLHQYTKYYPQRITLTL